jgi:16S rRNA (cytidine1402-2'-O)-methyltransferase
LENQSENVKGCVLYVVATPIGNLGDVTPRLRNVLSSVDLLACEDTRVTGKLLERLEITAPKLISYHDNNEQQKASDIITQMIDQDLSVAIVSDAGSPCISDPGYRLVSLAHENDIKVVPIVGPSALITLAMASGLPTDRFSFIGFLPHKKEARKKEVSLWTKALGSVLFYESATRIEDSLKIIKGVWPNAMVAVGRELTKTYEEIVSLKIVDAVNWIEKKISTNTLKGEFVVMVSGFGEQLDKESMISVIKDEALKGYSEGKSHKKLLKEMSHYNMDRSELYQLLLEVKKSIPK